MKLQQKDTFQKIKLLLDKTEISPILKFDKDKTHFHFYNLINYIFIVLTSINYCSEDAESTIPSSGRGKTTLPHPFLYYDDECCKCGDHHLLHRNHLHPSKKRSPIKPNW